MSGGCRSDGCRSEGYRREGCSSGDCRAAVVAVAAMGAGWRPRVIDGVGVGVVAGAPLVSYILGGGEGGRARTGD
jgi:hypothetical protein